MKARRSTEAGVMKQQLIRREFGREPMYRSGPSSIAASDVTDGGPGAAVRFRLLPRSGQLSVDRGAAHLDGRAFDLLMVLIRVPGAGLDIPLHEPAAIRETTLRVGPLELDLLERAAKRGDRAIRLLPREFRLLEYMMRRRDEILSRAILLKEIWSYKFVPG